MTDAAQELTTVDTGEENTNSTPLSKPNLAAERPLDRPLDADAGLAEHLAAFQGNADSLTDKAREMVTARFHAQKEAAFQKFLDEERRKAAGEVIRTELTPVMQPVPAEQPRMVSKAMAESAQLAAEYKKASPEYAARVAEAVEDLKGDQDLPEANNKVGLGSTVPEATTPEYSGAPTTVAQATELPQVAQAQAVKKESAIGRFFRRLIGRATPQEATS